MAEDQISTDREGGGVLVKIEVDTADLDTAIEKANRLGELLQTANDIIDSLSRGLRSEA